MTTLYQGKTAVVTGGGGFIASHLIDALLAAGARVRAVSRRGAHYRSLEVEHVAADLTARPECERALKGADFVFHLAAIGWGFHENLKRQPELLTENVLLNSTVLDTAYRLGAERYLYTSSSAVYPAHLDEHHEAAAIEGAPHKSEEGFAWAKRLGEIQAKTYHDHCQLPVAIVRPSNPYGPRDNFDPDKSHVIPALIRRACSEEEPFAVWGTGRPVRSFIHARDVAAAMLLALEKAADATPVNLASAQTITIADLVRLVLDLTGRTDVEIRFDTSKPDGHPRRVPNVQRAAERLGMTEYIPLDEGLRETIEWYRQQT